MNLLLLYAVSHHHRGDRVRKLDERAVLGLNSVVLSLASTVVTSGDHVCTLMKPCVEQLLEYDPLCGSEAGIGSEEEEEEAAAAYRAGGTPRMTTC